MMGLEVSFLGLFYLVGSEWKRLALCFDRN